MAQHLGVRYLRAPESPPSHAESAEELSRDAIAALPPALLAELRHAVITLDVDRISQTVGKVAQHDPALGSALARHAETYAYTAILRAVDGTKDGSGPASD